MAKGRASVTLMSKMAEKRKSSARHQRRAEEAKQRKAEKKGEIK